jgi:alkanesulfonate monooxygenase SsuD/methylene tetrahydromethanopterin reductase-like flavin-dependent oxidoreductase (luciferase family)
MRQGCPRHQLGGTLNSPRSLARPHPPVLVAGGGEEKTLRLVARYAQACNVGDAPDLEHKLAVLRQHCDDVGRDYDEIRKTVITRLDPGPQAYGRASFELLRQRVLLTT